MQKKLLLLGGSAAQVAAVTCAKDLGYYTVLCDYLPNTPGGRLADTFYQVSTTDKEAILKVAVSESVDGIVAYGSDPAAPTAAYVAERLGLPGIPYETARSFCEKGAFRTWLSDHGFNAPKSAALCETNQAVGDLMLPVIVKPDDSSGSKGITVINDWDELPEAYQAALGIARDGTVVVEEFVQRDHPHVIEAEIFVADGEVRSWCLMNTIRDKDANPLLPAAYTYPLQIGESREQLVRSEISRLIHEGGIRYGALNIEMIIDGHERLFFLDVGPRNGGNRLSEFVQMVGGKDVVAATLLAAMGEYDSIDVDLDGLERRCGLAVLHSLQSGVFNSIKYSRQALTALRKDYLNIIPGDRVQPFHICTDLVGLAFFEFADVDEMNEVMENPHVHMRVELGQ